MGVHVHKLRGLLNNRHLVLHWRLLYALKNHRVEWCIHEVLINDAKIVRPVVDGLGLGERLHILMHLNWLLLEGVLPELKLLLLGLLLLASLHHHWVHLGLTKLPFFFILHICLTCAFRHSRRIKEL